MTKHYAKLNWAWDDEGFLGDLSFICPYCGTESAKHTYDLEDVNDKQDKVILVCEKCGKKFIVRRETYLEDFEG